MGGKLRHYRVFKTEPSPADYVLAPLGPAVGVFALGCGDWAAPDSQGTTEPEDM